MTPAEQQLDMAASIAEAMHATSEAMKEMAKANEVLRLALRKYCTDHPAEGSGE